MKNKKAAQELKRKEHLQRLKKAKKKRRNQAPNLERNEAVKTEKEKILIVCEGENTEPSYFQKFKLSTATIKTVGEGRNTLSLVTRAIELSEEETYDQVWCVFDKDDFPAHNFDNAIIKAKANGLKVAYSNQAFEYWLILHFENHQGGGMHRNDYCSKLKNYLKPFGVDYDCNSKRITDEVFDVLSSKLEASDKSRQELACERAERISENKEGESPAQAESSTKVQDLVQEIERFK